VPQSDAPDASYSPIVAADAEPTVAGSGRSVAEIVHKGHEEGPDAALAELTGTEDVTRKQLADLLTFCAEQRCGDAGLACRGCSLHTRRAGIASMDDWIAQYERVVTRDTGLEVLGAGQGEQTIDSLSWLQRNWAGEDYWFWARRVLRKLRYGVRQVEDLINHEAAHLSTPAVLLVEPQIPENIGMVARAMGNFGLDDLRVVNPRDGWPSEKARAVASGAAAIIDDAKLCPTLDAGIGDLNWVVATTARQRDLRKPVMTPEVAAQEFAVRISRGEKCGILFGRERNGLDSDEVVRADAIVMIPVNSRFASLNLAQSVLLLGYEWLKAAGAGTLGRVTTYERPMQAGVNLGSSRPATKAELQGLFEHLENELEQRGFFYPSHRRHVVVRNVRTMLMRMEATDQEVRTMRGIVATLTRRKRDVQTG